MRFCESHWSKLRKAIDDRGLTPFVAKDGHVAMAQMVKQVEENHAGKDTFDPLMGAHWAISCNVMDFLGRAGGPSAALRMLTGDICPLCEINEAHERTCTDPLCKLDKKVGYDWMIDRAADDALDRAREYGLVK